LKLAGSGAERHLAEVAKANLTEIVAGQALEIDRRGKDHFGRTLAYIRVQARMSARW
jgi:endonuclease YncB( thermonuclease family)